ncbi:MULTISPECIES: hypothetical protein [Thermodesulfovibrio]|uniref:hypothetical protein n=1 Tax=Thermodesulfovibrio TaxID=28261 RepID=UPI0026026674|nr:hypothetical protein [Thermodesulfovibrio sp.]
MQVNYYLASHDFFCYMAGEKIKTPFNLSFFYICGDGRFPLRADTGNSEGAIELLERIDKDYNSRLNMLTKPLFYGKTEKIKKQKNFISHFPRSL